MDSLMLTSSFSIDKVKNVKLIIGLSDLTTIVFVVRKHRETPFYITSDDWELFNVKLREVKRKVDTTFFYGTNMCVSTTEQQHLIMSYYQSWVNKLLHNEPHSLTLSAKATTNLINLLPTINSVVEKMRDFTAVSGVNGLAHNSMNLPPSPTFNNGFYAEVNS